MLRKGLDVTGSIDHPAPRLFKDVNEGQLGTSVDGDSCNPNVSYLYLILKNHEPDEATFLVEIKQAAVLRTDVPQTPTYLFGEKQANLLFWIGTPGAEIQRNLLHHAESFHMVRVNVSEGEVIDTADR